METNEMTMTSNVPVSVSTNSNIAKGEVYDPNTAEHVEEEKVNEYEKIDNGIELSQKNNDVPDKVMESAKDEGFLEALTHLADGDFDEKIGEPENGREENDEPGSELDEVNQEKDINLDDQEKNKEEVLINRIKELEVKVVDLEEKNKNLFEQVHALQENNQLALQTLMEMTLILQELLKEEEDNEKKVSLLELLVEIMSKLMVKMFVPEEEGSENSKAQNAETPKKDKPKKSTAEIMELLRQKGFLRNQQPQQHAPRNNVPVIENGSS